MFVIHDAGVVVINAPTGPTKFALAAVRSVTTLPITHLVYTHSHNDHIGDAWDFIGNSTLVIAHHETTSVLLNRRDEMNSSDSNPKINVPLPDISFSPEYNLTVGVKVPVEIYLLSLGSSHVPGNLFVWLPTQKILMYVDVITPRWAPGYELYCMREPGLVVLDFKEAVVSTQSTFFFFFFFFFLYMQLLLNEPYKLYQKR
eukprot:TRINITY_DN12622_c0_g1_i2.p1 TRINITY_DN12622_c0_g1~~TRINITY_DN12622_c0_g1_i2.p1  ORF type:complete len:201 (-),score=35.42 TRINITY_DN12622_c0_g1_i2:357-959(-)